MAQIDISTIEKIDKDRPTVHIKVCTTYSTFDSEGKHYVQLDTYGRSDRARPEKISQSIQFDEETAAYLIDLLKSEFGF